ncbi:ProP Permease of the major facilitator superfamily [Pyrenophora tritici-repentis]|uniref:Allantoin permease n=2 Tax=Pyrenophora tritici-repentis TaxID=45151 RepID=A0A2W1FH74_9PLEO|nr:allantoin permease [Pyrenophora tritici-repentis Pt-1C-BFP]KAA8626518.1 Allantoin permease [Pyrenophora tritici-repentis]EDU41251.1 allantoin permease [Pyrenophora tritici-repentis Pt-1C-BFP]KAF7454944.1 Allantoin permease [Pyrenophora tritici-repentis]KAF7578091.1 ProP, Permease major facilitator superfamily [Pyrenophora tritici-repentis]KAG9388705.1 Allantoin permease [Pyrenophora tritici-repentis]
MGEKEQEISPAREPSVDEGQIAAEKQMRDIGADLYLEVQQYSREELEAERKIVLRKIDWVIMPMICMTYTIQFLDKLSLNYANAYSLTPDLGLEGDRYSWVAAIFNFGYLFWALPANYLIQRLPVSKYTGSMILLWSILLCCHVAAKNYAGMLALRFLLGMFEASISPAIMNIVSMFYTRDEQPLRMCVFLAFNGVATMVGALLGYGLGHAHSSHIKTWQLIFLVIGLLNFVWAWVFLWVMPDSPSTAKFLTHKQRIVAIDRIATNNIGVKTKHFQAHQALEAVLDFKVLCISLIGLCCGVINGGVSNFSSSLLRGFGFSGIYATLLQLPTGAIEFLVVPLCGLAAGYFKNTRCLILAVVCLPPLAGLLGIRLISLSHRWSLVGCTWLQYIVGAPVILSWNLLTTNIAGHTKRSTANGMWFVFYAAGNIAGANIFFAREKPRYYSALTGLIVCYCAMVVLGGVLAVWMGWQNKRRDRLWGKGQDEQAIRDGFSDLTDMQAKHFRYAL